jgi:hypothetical protein
MKLTVAGIEFTIDDHDLQLAFVSYGEDENNPLFERSSLFVTKEGEFYLVGGGGSLSLWRTQKGAVWDFDVGRIPLTYHTALAWAGRFAPAAAHWIVVVGQARHGGI